MGVIVKQIENVSDAALFSYEMTRRCIASMSCSSKIIIKPNITYPKAPHSGVTTHHEVVQGILDALAGFTNVHVVESDATSSDFEENIAGWDCEFLKQYKDVAFVNLSKSPSHKEILVGKNKSYEVEIPDLLTDYDLLINLPVLKTHILTGVSLGMKNLFGLLPVKQKSHYHIDIHDFVYALYRRFHTDLTIVDGIEGIEGQGPIFGDPAHAKVMLAGSDIVEVDLVGTSSMGIEPGRVQYLQHAVLHKYGALQVPDVEVIGDCFHKNFTRFPVLPVQILRALLATGENTLEAIVSQIDAPTQTKRNVPIFIQSLITRGLLIREDETYRLNFGYLDRLIALFPDTREVIDDHYSVASV